MTLMSYDGDDGFNDLIPDPYASIPAELKQEKRWLVYRMEPIPGSSKKNKIPHDPKTGRKANNPELGVTFEEAKAALKDYSGLGFYVESPYVVIDLDNCINTETGLVDDYAAKVIREVNSFAEASPSGTGIHIWAKGEKPGAACRRGIEIYSTKRFLTVTGIHIPGTPAEVRSVDIAPVYNRMLAGEFQGVVEIPSASPIEPVPPIKIAEVLHSGTVVTTKLQLLMTGEVVSTKPFIVEDLYKNCIHFPSQSEADLSLVTLLAFKHEGDIEKIDGDFRVSCLYRAKWDRQDYRDATLKSAANFYKKSKVLEALPVSASQMVIEDNDEEVLVEEDLKLPDFPQFTGSLADLCNAMSPDILYPFKFSVALAHFGLIRSGLDTLAAEPHIQPRFYVALIGRPGCGKTAAINEMSKVIRSLSNGYRVFSSIDSGPALCDAFVELQREGILKTEIGENLSDSFAPKILLSPDELKGLFEKSKITTSSRNSMLDEMLKLYESNTTGNRVRGAKIKIHIENAHLGIIGGATEGGYSAMWTGTGGAADGLQSRIVPIGVDDYKMPSMQRRPDGDRLATAILKIAEQIKQSSQTFEFSPEAFEMYDSWWKAKGQDKPSEVRIDGIVKRLLIVLARTNEVNVIGTNLMQQAIDFGDFVIQCREKYNPLDSATWVQMQENLIIAVYQRKGPLSPNHCRRLVHPERRPGGAGPFLQAFKNLVATGILKEVAKTQRDKVYKISL